MVVTFEPFYMMPPRMGFHIEDMFLVTESGYETLTAVTTNDTLIEVPAVMSHYDKTPEQLSAMGLEPNLIRMSVGCEPMDDLIRDLDFLLEG